MLKPSHVASFDVDCQYAFTPLCREELPVNDALSIVAELNQQAAYAQYRLGSKDAHAHNAHWVATPERPAFSKIEHAPNMDSVWPVHAVPGTFGFQWLYGLPPVTAYDYFVWKGIELDMHPYGACYHDLTERLSTGVIEFLKVRGVTSVLIGGLATDYCVKATALQLQHAGFQVIVNRLACRGVGVETTQEACALMAEAGVVFVDTAEALSSRIAR